MYFYQGRVEEIQLDHQGRAAAWINCPKEAIPAPGQYLLAFSPVDEEAPLGRTIFCSEISNRGFLSIPPIPRSWEPGTSLELRGSLGHGFKLPRDLQRLGLISLDSTITYLLPLAIQAIQNDCSVALFADGPLPPLPSALEAHPLSASPEAVRWADYLAIGLKLESLPALRTRLDLGTRDQLACPAQALILACMPCSGLAECGACAAPARRGWKMTCKDGPVFDLGTLEW